MRIAREKQNQHGKIAKHYKGIWYQNRSVESVSKTMKEEQERIKNLVNSLEVKQKRIEGELSFVVDWCKKNNLLIFGTDEYPHESYFDMLKITEEFF
jgi:hypothetical protein